MYKPNTHKNYPQSRVPGTTAPQVKVACSNRFNFKAVRFRAWYVATLVFPFLMAGREKAGAQPFTIATGSPIQIVSGTGATTVWNLTAREDITSHSYCQDQISALWSNSTVDFTGTVDIVFYANFDNEDGTIGADGIGIVFGTNINPSTTPPVGGGGNLGYYDDGAGDFLLADYNSSFIVEYDIFWDPASICGWCGDGSSGSTVNIDHSAVASNQNGNSVMTASTGGVMPVAITGGSIRDGITRKCEIIWTPPGTGTPGNLKMYYDCHLIFSNNYNYQTIFGSGADLTHIHWGFTASTGNYCSDQLVSLSYFPNILTLCNGNTGFIPIAFPGGSWTNSNPSVASVTPGSTGGTVIGLSAGTTNITYTESSGCQQITIVNINPLPVTITGITAVCVGSTTTLTDATTGGTWSSSNTTIATIGSTTGVVTGINPGTCIITYTLATGCFTTITINVSSSLTTAITGSHPICLGSSLSLADITPGGTWTSVSPGVATISSSGVVTSVSAGTTIIFYSTGVCSTVSTLVIVNPNPVVSSPGVILCCPDGTGTFATSVDGITDVSYLTADYIFNWWGGTGLSSYTIPDPSVDCSIGTTTIYNLTVTNSSTGCTTTIAVTAEYINSKLGNPCSPCNIGFEEPVCGGLYAPLGVPTSGTTGTISANVPAGNYYLANDVTITGNITFTDAVVMIALDAHIYVAPGSCLTIKGSHLFSCISTMWKGIVLQSDATETGTLVLEGDAAGVSTLVEDAKIGVDVENPITPNSYQINFVTSTNTIFNKCWTGIQVAGSPVSTLASAPFTYAFDIENTVFTGRNFGNYWMYITGASGPFCTYPTVWPSNYSTYGLKTTWAPPNQYMPHFNIANPATWAGGYPVTGCNIATSTAIGIKLTNVGTYTPATNAYRSIQIGELGSYSPCGPYPDYDVPLNLFDELNFGIWASDASVTVLNNTFTNMIPDAAHNLPTVSGDGIFASKGSWQTPAQLSVIPGVVALYCRFSPPIAYIGNSFYNCPYGVYAYNYDSVAGIHSYMVTTQTNATSINSGYYGYDLQAGPHWKDYNITYNDIYNVANGIVMKIAVPGGYSVPLGAGPGQATIDQNHIQAAYSNTYSYIGTAFVNNAIWVDNTVSYMYGFGTTPHITTQVNVDSNELGNVYNGIYMNGFSLQTATSNADTVTMIQYPAYLAGTAQYGIWHTNCVSDQVKMNEITGEPATTSLYMNDVIYGVKESGANLHTVTCNQVTNVGRGFEFDNTNSYSWWTHNFMTNNGKGYVMNGGQIWTQGSAGGGGSAMFESGNQWLTSGSFAWAVSNYQTYTELGAVPTNSLLNIMPYTATDPVSNTNLTLIYPDIYGWAGGTTITGNGNGLNIISSSGTYSSCYSSPFHHFDAMYAIAQKQDAFGVYNNQHAWMSQFDLWKAMCEDSTLADSSIILATFKQLATNSRYSLLTLLDEEIAEGNLDTAKYLLSTFGIDSLINTTFDSTTGVQMADDTTADIIVRSYRQYYQLYINYLKDSMTSNDSVLLGNLAGACPFAYGEVVYNARALYDIVFDTMAIFTYTCDSAVLDSGGSHRSGKVTTNRITADDGGQSYTLMPNPNNGSFILQQAITDNKPVDIEVMNAVGQNIYKQEMIFVKNVSNINLNAIQPGLYLIKLMDNKGREFIFKFMVR